MDISRLQRCNPFSVGVKPRIGPLVPTLADVEGRRAANAGFNASWELDFWGQFRRGDDSASATLGPQIASYDNALVLLTADVASVYIQICSL